MIALGVSPCPLVAQRRLGVRGGVSVNGARPLGAMAGAVGRVVPVSVSGNKRLLAGWRAAVAPPACVGLESRFWTDVRFGPGGSRFVGCGTAVGAGTGGGEGPRKLAVFVSGGGSNFRKIHEACVAGKAHGEVAVVVTNKWDCGGAEYARSQGIPVLVYPPRKEDASSMGITPAGLVDSLTGLGVQSVLLAGYLKLIPAELCRAYPRDMLNIHPALLPDFGGPGYYGMRVHRAVVEAGRSESGPTVHFVSERYDEGPILAQRRVALDPSDSPEDVAAKVLAEEHRLFPECVAALCAGRVAWTDDGTPSIVDNA